MGNLISEPFTRLSAIQNITNQLGAGFPKYYGVSFLNITVVIV